MKDEAFGFSGDCHDPGLAGWLGLPFPLASVISAEAEIQVRVFHTDGSPPPTAGMTEKGLGMTEASGDERRGSPKFLSRRCRRHQFC
jgi:hypothetical protein